MLLWRSTCTERFHARRGLTWWWTSLKISACVFFFFFFTDRLLQRWRHFTSVHRGGILRGTPQQGAISLHRGPPLLRVVLVDVIAAVRQTETLHTEPLRLLFTCLCAESHHRRSPRPDATTAFLRCDGGLALSPGTTGHLGARIATSETKKCHTKRVGGEGERCENAER